MNRPTKKIWPFLCPFCDDISFPVPNVPVRRDDHQNWELWRCEAGHEFYVYQKVCKDQDWANNKYNSPSVIKKDAEWRKQMRGKV